MNTKNIAVILSANATSFKSQMALASGAVKEFQSSTDSATSTASKWAGAVKVAAAAIAVAVGVAAIASLRMAIDFDRSMRNVNSISKLNEQQFQHLEKSVIQLSTTVPQSAKTLALGLYDIASSGFQGASGLEILGASAKAASAGLSDTATASNAILAVINAYGLTARDATQVSNVLFQTVNLGVITFGELAAQIGDVVGIAAAGKISINEVGAAIAAMTLSGISGAEATTSLNRVIQSIIEPSDSLGNLFHTLGYESGNAALQALGLHGVMDKLRVVTGGNIEALLTLFPNIRAARGAFALMAADGANYARTFAAIGSDTAVAGATQAAFAEQMKAVSAQWDIFTNKISAGAITLGTEALPALSATMIATQKFGDVVISTAEDVAGKLEPFFTGIGESAASLGSIIGEVASDFTPLVKLIAALSAGAAIETLNGLATALSATTGFMADHKTLLEILIVLYGSRWVASMLSAQGALGTLAIKAMYLKDALLGLNIVQSIGLRLMYLKDALLGLSGVGTSISDLRAAFSGLGGAAASAGRAILHAVTSPTVAIAALVLVIGGIVNAFQNANQHAQELVSTLNAGVKLNDIASMTNALNASFGAMRTNLNTVRGYRDSTGALRAEWEVLNPLVKNTALDSAKALEAATQNAMALQNAILNVESATSGLAIQILNMVHPGAFSSVTEYQTKLDETRIAIRKLANEKGIDLSKINVGDTQALGQLADELGPLFMEIHNGTPTTDGLATSMHTLADATSTATDKLKAYKSALDAALGVHIASFDAQTKYAKSLNDLATATAKYGTNLDALTEGGQANREALSGAAKAALDHAVAIGQETGDIKEANRVLAAHVAEIQGFLVQSGMTPAAAQEFTDALGLTQGNLQGVIGLTNDATGGLDTFQKKLAGTDGMKISAFEIMDVSGWRSANGEILGSVGALQDQIVAFLAQKKILYVDGAPAKVTLETLMASLQTYGEASPEAQALLQYAPAEKGFTTLQQWIDDYKASDPTAAANLDTAEVDREIAWMTKQLDIATRKREILIEAHYEDKGFKPSIAPGQTSSTSKVGRWGRIDYAYAVGGITPAHIAHGERIKYAEKATGGEAYIPRLGNTTRSTAILAHAARWYGMKVTPMATGGVTDIISGIQQTGAAQSAAAANLRDTSVGQSVVANAYAGVDTSNADEVARAEERITQDLQRLAEAYVNVQQAAGQSAADQLAAANLTADQFTQASQQIVQAAQAQTDAAKKAADEQVVVQRQVEDNMFTLGKISADAYVEILRKRMEGLTEYSDEWMQLNDKINAVLSGQTDAQAQSQKSALEKLRNMYEFGAASADQLVAALKHAQQGLEKYSDEWSALQREIDQVTGATKQSASGIARAFGPNEGAGTMSAGAAMQQAMQQQAQQGVKTVAYPTRVGDQGAAQGNFTVTVKLDTGGRPIFLNDPGDLRYMAQQLEGSLRSAHAKADLTKPTQMVFGTKQIGGFG